MLNNIFGHAASALYPGKKGQTVPGGKWWRAYNSIADAIAAHIGILQRPLYKLAGVLNAKTPYSQARALQLAVFPRTGVTAGINPACQADPCPIQLGEPAAI